MLLLGPSTALLLLSPPPLPRAAGVALCAVDISAITLDDVRKTPPLELEEFIEELEADAANSRDATGQVDAALSRLLAVAHSCMGDHENAAPHAQQALEDGPPDAEMHFVLGVEAERRDAQDDALEQYELALEVDPKCWRALFHTGKIALSFGWPSDAVDYFKQVAEINPAHAPTQAFLARLEEAGIDVEDWQAGKDVDGSDDDGEEGQPPAAPDMPEGMSDFKL